MTSLIFPNSDLPEMDFSTRCFPSQVNGIRNRGTHYSKTLAEADAFLVELGWIQK
ncbi:hypothetical protein SH501x_004699 [Pirellulaceae bacterium SH501]